MSGCVNVRPEALPGSESADQVVNAEFSPYPGDLQSKTPSGCLKPGRGLDSSSQLICLCAVLPLKDNQLQLQKIDTV